MAPRRSLILLLVGAAFGLILAGCSPNEPPVRERAGGATRVTLLTEDDVHLDARLWVTHPERLAIYLHEFREDQSSWWEYARQSRNPAISSLTLDLRGHGESEGEWDDIPGMLMDIDAAISWAREAGYRSILLVGAGMGGAVAMVAAAGHDDIAVLGLSVPSEFDVLTPLAVAPHLQDRLALAASRDDLSAAHSLSEFLEVVDLPEERVRLNPGRTHGVKMLDGRAGADVRSYFEDQMARLWRPRQTG